MSYRGKKNSPLPDTCSTHSRVIVINDGKGLSALMFGYPLGYSTSRVLSDKTLLEYVDGLRTHIKE